MSTTAAGDSTPLARTPLHALHVELGGKLVPFAGYEMPVQYKAGITKEHLHTRDKAGLFDVSHMGQLWLKGEGAARAIESLVPADIVDLGPMRQRYTFFTNDQGGILDDLMVTNAGDRLFVVVNAACKQQDIAHMQDKIGGHCEIDILDDRALLALQGPAAAEVLAGLDPAVASMPFMSALESDLEGVRCFVTRSGYTGEDGYEISLPASQAEAFARRLLAHDAVEPIGLGARDTLRLEAGLCLYGNDIDSETTPVEASLTWAIGKVRRAEGARAGGFPGDRVILGQMAEGATKKRVGVRPGGRVPVRAGAEIVDDGGAAIGRITSGGFGPSVGGPVAMGYVEKSHAKPDTELSVVVRGKALPAKVARLPFVEQRYYRG